MNEVRVRAGDTTADHPRICSALAGTPGITRAEFVDGSYVVAYDEAVLGCADVLAALSAAGGRPAPDLLERLRLKLRCYRDAIERDEQMNELGWDSFVREIYVSRYRHRPHGRRDERPRNWRHYDNRTPD